MRILITNDDSVSASQLLPLIQWCSKHGDVTTVVPKFEQSGKSHGIELHTSFTVKEVALAPDITAYAVDSTPADCVRIALRGGLLRQQPDVVISGINNGHNAGMDVHYSGTVAAAMEGSMAGIRAIAASAAWKAPAEALYALAKLTIDMAERYSRIPPLPMSVMNINAPAELPDYWKPTVYAPLNVSTFQDGYERRESPFGGTYYWLTGCAEPAVRQEGTDQWYLSLGHVTVTMLGNFASLTTQEWNSLGI